MSTDTTTHAPTYGPPNAWTRRSDDVSCSCGWSWHRGPNTVAGAARIFDNHARARLPHYSHPPRVGCTCDDPARDGCDC